MNSGLAEWPRAGHLEPMSDFPDAQIVDAGGVNLAAYEWSLDHHRDTPPVILIHGWPEIAYSWKSQLKALSERGFRAIAIDLKGFGASDAPKDKSLYDIRHITDDLENLLDALSIDRAIFCGHDWGGAIVWPMAQLKPARVAGVIGVCTPHRKAPPVPPLTILKKRFTERHYFIQFQEEDAPEALFTGEEEKFFRQMFRAAPPREVWPKLIPRIFDITGRFEHGPAPGDDEIIISPTDLAVFVDAYKRSGFHGGINLYRNVDRNYEITKDLNPVIKMPSLWIGAENDLFLPPDSAGDMDALVPDLEKHILADCGHWVMWERPEALNELLIDWLSRRFS